MPTDNLSPGKLSKRPKQRKSTDKEFIFQNLENGISLFNAETLETKLLMDNSSFVSQNEFTFCSRHHLNLLGLRVSLVNRQEKKNI